MKIARKLYRRLKGRWCSLCLLLLSVLPMGCYATDWRWIWETRDDDACSCFYVPVAPPPGEVVR